MQEFQDHKRHSGFISRHRTLAAALAVVLLSGAGFAVAGGADVVKRVFVKVKITLIGPDGVGYDGIVLESDQNGDGTATMTLDIGEDDQATVTVQQIELMADELTLSDSGEAMTMVTVSLEGGPQLMAETESGEAIQLHATAEVDAAHALPAEDGSIDGLAPAGLMEREMRKVVAARKTVLLREIDPADWIEEWIDENGEWQELHIVPTSDDVNSSHGFRVYRTTTDDEGEAPFRQVGFLGVNPETAEISDVEVDENGLATIRVLDDEGAEAVMELDTRRAAPSGTGVAKVSITTGEAGERQIQLRRADKEKE